MSRPGRARWPAAAAGQMLTAARLAVSPWLFFCIEQGRFFEAAGVLAVGMASDLLDGPLVRYAGCSTRFGAWFDIHADLALITAAFAGLAMAGVLPWWPLWAIGASFVVFVATSRKRLYDPLGRSIGGVLMGAALGVLIAPDLAVQLTLGWLAGIASIMTIAGRLSVMLLPAVDGHRH
ncbi:MAG TPA: CDP-alcohol phosphatidyltransferase family protein [Ideonella sp.]|uniref:CDP-alcohol phosphatidyltransferase family protein n=1 Tax=Ideonella sp. TaxID=1929293 RepID=UPI002E37117E|nr:CDP-alcohol phosphatidyltransferase family protein [Ideonella sp.]HEX5686237.1 CDP-alcohol phosphatidyltransferase family protein [Ideonella sp.]